MEVVFSNEPVLIEYKRWSSKLDFDDQCDTRDTVGVRDVLKNRGQSAL